MKKSRYMALLTIVTVGCIIGGILHHIGGVAGGSIGSKGRGWFVFRGAGNSKQETLYAEEPDAEGAQKDVPSEIQSIMIQGDIMDVDIVRGESFRVDYRGNDLHVPEVQVSGSELIITQNARGGFFGFDFSSLNSMLTITIPQDRAFTSLVIQSDTGRIKCQELQADHTEITTDTGSIEMTSCALGELNAESDTGRINCQELQADHTEITTDTGSIEMTSCAPGELNAESDTGGITVRACTLDHADINTDTGSVKFFAPDLKQYTLDLRSELGRITVNGEKMRHSYRHDGSGTGHIRIETETGRITLNEE